MPEELELPLTIPVELGPAVEVRAELRGRSCATEYAPSRSSGRPSGRAPGVACWVSAVLAQSWRGSR